MADTNIAPIKIRLISAMIDFFIYFTIVILEGSFFGASLRGTVGQDGSTYSFGYSFSGYNSLIPILSWLILFPFIEGITGKTIGKKVMNIKVLKKNYTKISVFTSFLRHLVDMIDLMFFIGFYIASKNRYKQRIGGLIANTIVVLDKRGVDLNIGH